MILSSVSDSLTFSLVKLLLAFASTVSLGLGSRWNPWPYFFVHSKTFTCFEMGPPQRQEGSDYCRSLPLYWGVTRAGTYSPTSRFLHTPLTNFRSKSHYDRRSVGQSVLGSSPISGPRPDFCYCQTFAVSSTWDALSDERTGLSFVTVIFSSA
jgi:hypothetical protein